MTQRKQARLYTTAQLTTARLPNIHDLAMRYDEGSGQWLVNCDLQPTSPCPLSELKPSLEVVEGYGVVLLRMYGRLWISWKDACKLHSTGRQFLNYRVLNHCPNLDMIRLQPAEARVLSAITEGGWMPANRDSKLIFFDHKELAKVPLQPFKKRAVKPSRGGSGEGESAHRKDRGVGKRKHSVAGSDDESSDAYDYESGEDDEVVYTTSPVTPTGAGAAAAAAAAAGPYTSEFAGLADAADDATPVRRTESQRKRVATSRALGVADDESGATSPTDAGSEPASPVHHRLRERSVRSPFVARALQQQQQREDFERWMRLVLSSRSAMAVAAASMASLETVASAASATSVAAAASQQSTAPAAAAGASSSLTAAVEDEVAGMTAGPMELGLADAASGDVEVSFCG